MEGRGTTWCTSYSRHLSGRFIIARQANGDKLSLQQGNLNTPWAWGNSSREGDRGSGLSVSMQMRMERSARGVQPGPHSTGGMASRNFVTQEGDNSGHTICRNKGEQGVGGSNEENLKKGTLDRGMRTLENVGSDRRTPWRKFEPWLTWRMTWTLLCSFSMEAASRLASYGSCGYCWEGCLRNKKLWSRLWKCSPSYRGETSCVAWWNSTTWWKHPLLDSQKMKPWNGMLRWKNETRRWRSHRPARVKQIWVWAKLTLFFHFIFCFDAFSLCLH